MSTSTDLTFDFSRKQASYGVLSNPSTPTASKQDVGNLIIPNQQNLSPSMLFKQALSPDALARAAEAAHSYPKVHTRKDSVHNQREDLEITFTQVEHGFDAFDDVNGHSSGEIDPTLFSHPIQELVAFSTPDLDKGHSDRDSDYSTDSSSRASPRINTACAARSSTPQMPWNASAPAAQYYTILTTCNDTAPVYEHFYTNAAQYPPRLTPDYCTTGPDCKYRTYPGYPSYYEFKARACALTSPPPLQKSRFASLFEKQQQAADHKRKQDAIDVARGVYEMVLEELVPRV